jgi:predicted metal-dependent enzyme (double-stranded beta helix superfamily)
MLDPEQLVNSCIGCLARGGTPEDVAALVRLALVSQREDSLKWGKREIIYCADDLLVVDVTLPPYATSAIHDHRTWAVVGVSAGCEVDWLFAEQEVGGPLRHVNSHELGPGVTLVLQPDCIHFIANPRDTPARGIHVYGRNLALTERRMWDPFTGTAQPMDFVQFEEWEHSLTARSAAAKSIVPPWSCAD